MYPRSQESKCMLWFLLVVLQIRSKQGFTSLRPTKLCCEHFSVIMLTASTEPSRFSPQSLLSGLDVALDRSMICSEFETTPTCRTTYSGDSTLQLPLGHNNHTSLALPPTPMPLRLLSPEQVRQTVSSFSLSPPFSSGAQAMSSMRKVDHNTPCLPAQPVFPPQLELGMEPRLKTPQPTTQSAWQLLLTIEARHHVHREAQTRPLPVTSKQQQHMAAPQYRKSTACMPWCQHQLGPEHALSHDSSGALDWDFARLADQLELSELSNMAWSDKPAARCIPPATYASYLPPLDVAVGHPGLTTTLDSCVDNHCTQAPVSLPPLAKTNLDPKKEEESLDSRSSFPSIQLPFEMDEFLPLQDTQKPADRSTTLEAAFHPIHLPDIDCVDYDAQPSSTTAIPSLLPQRSTRHETVLTTTPISHATGTTTRRDLTHTGLTPVAETRRLAKSRSKPRPISPRHKILLAWYEQHAKFGRVYLGPEDKVMLSEKSGLTQRQVATFIQNKRNRDRRSGAQS
eukprot:m.25412 g.25412  ORF g.25412 m.25412 type:complete len:511 (+) comp8704_c0_seq2:517-2049(+)